MCEGNISKEGWFQFSILNLNDSVSWMHGLSDFTELCICLLSFHTWPGTSSQPLGSWQGASGAHWRSQDSPPPMSGTRSAAGRRWSCWRWSGGTRQLVALHCTSKEKRTNTSIKGNKDKNTSMATLWNRLALSVCSLFTNLPYSLAFLETHIYRACEIELLEVS